MSSDPDSPHSPHSKRRSKATSEPSTQPPECDSTSAAPDPDPSSAPANPESHHSSHSKHRSKGSSEAAHPPDPEPDPEPAPADPDAARSSRSKRHSKTSSQPADLEPVRSPSDPDVSAEPEGEHSHSKHRPIVPRDSEADLPDVIPPPEPLPPAPAPEPHDHHSDSYESYSDSDPRCPPAKRRASLPGRIEPLIKPPASAPPPPNDESSDSYAEPEFVLSLPVRVALPAQASTVVEDAAPGEEASPAPASDVSALPTSSGPPKRKVDRYGWDVTKSADDVDPVILARESEKEQERELKWIKMLGPEILPTGDKPMTFAKFRKANPEVFEERVMKGIPDSCRSRAWQLILDPEAEAQPQRKSIDEYLEEAVPACDNVIKKDIPRTMPHVEMFAKEDVRDSLYRILRAYANADPELGYYQGMAFPAALLLAYMNEERTFWAFYHLLNDENHLVRQMYLHDFEGLTKVNKVWSYVLQMKYPKIHSNLHILAIDEMVYTPSWFLTAFLNLDFPPVFRLRIMDRYITFGTRAVMSLALALVGLCKDELLQSQMEVVIPILQNPAAGARTKNWREIIEKWDKFFISPKDYKRYFAKVGEPLVP